MARFFLSQFAGKGKISVKVWVAVLSLVVYFFLSHTGQLEAWDSREGPTVRVGIVQGEERKCFSISGGFSMFNGRGDMVSTIESAGGRWKVRLLWGRPAEMVYFVVVEEEREKKAAEMTVSKLEGLGYRALVRVVGRRLEVGGRVINDNTRYWVTTGPYGSQEEAESVSRRLEGLFSPEVMADIKTEPWGMMEFIDPGGRVSLIAEDVIRVVPTDLAETRITVHDVKVGKDFHWEHSENRTYRGIMEFRIDNQGRITIINELPLEKYLYGVVPAEMNSTFPVEALKAQAVAARSRALFEMSKKHRLVAFDLSADVYSQVYGGVSKEDSITSLAVEKTRGQVIRYNGEVANALYSGVSGGRTEDPAKIWGGAPIPYLRSVWDANPASLKDDWPTTLDSEKAVAKWVKSSPRVYCNTRQREIPKGLEYTRKYFRWQVAYTRRDLERIIKKKTGQQIGLLLDIIPRQRGDSGRLTEVEIRGSKKRFRIKGELEIRKALSENHLYSSCFIVKKAIGRDGLPSRFTFIGAGWGHGVGMCQTGAAVMALEGKRYDQILRHYFQGVEIVALY